jgi:hypothetical protein
MKTEEIVAMMREHAALLNLEAEVVIALKAYQVGHEPTLTNQINQIIVCLQRLDEVRRRNEKSISQEDA